MMERSKKIESVAKKIAEALGYDWNYLREIARWGGMDRTDFRAAAQKIVDAQDGS